MLSAGSIRSVSFGHEEHDCFPDTLAIMPYEQIVTIIDLQYPLRHAPEVLLVVINAHRRGELSYG